MADPRFFKRAPGKTLEEIASLTGSEISGVSRAGRPVVDVAPLDLAGPDDLSFFDNRKYRDQFSDTKAGVCILAPQNAGFAPKHNALLLNDNPYKAYALAAAAFYPDVRPPPTIAASAHVHPSAKIGQGCVVEEGTVIGAGVEIGDHCWIGTNAVISHTLIGNNVRIYPGCCIGQDGFGFAPDPAGHVKVPQLGRVIIEDSVEIGANTCIDRGAGPDTIIGRGTWIDNLVQIGHNVKIGKGCIIVAQVGISGSTVIEDYAVLAGQVGVAGHLRIGKGARIAAQSGLMRDVEPGAEVMGSPAVPLRQFMRQIALLNRLIKKDKP